MKGSDDILNDKLTGKEVNAINRDVVVFIFFLFLSFSLWYINSLEKVVEADINYPFNYINVPDDRVINEVMPERLSLSLKGPGYSILKIRILHNTPAIQIDLSKVSYKNLPESKNPDYFIITSGLIRNFTNQIRSGCEITAIKPDTLFFTLGRIIKK